MMYYKIIFFLCYSLCLFAQENEQIQSQLQKYESCILQKKFLESCEYIYPRTFETITKEEFAFAMEQTFNDTTVQVRIDSIFVQKYGQNFSYQGGNYTPIKYSTMLRMSFKEQTDSDLMKITLSVFKTKYGDKNVRYDPITHAFFITTSETMLAIKDQYSPNWTFLRTASKKAHELLPKKVVKKLLNKQN
ncbi:MAG TPA: hypothetical protein PK230_12955 [Chitinophagales bacterium]|nr:hypothetical protein [Chitinophagales bacterium]